ncbi:hypothetical protein [Leifsonia sp. EB34]|uniref:arsenate reductase/protein-tyrosine-phosphatase family protein n=1 Tax=Leifsonia sp. EB34 TaxID=3156303 RepID=UPI003516A12B
MPVIVVVCTANVCRSPLAAAILDAGLRSSYPGTLTLLSAGTAVRDEQELCASTVRQLAARRIPGYVAERSRAGQLDTGLVDTADLILTADTAQRAIVAQLSTAARSRTFTLREATYLLEGAARLRASEPEPLDFSESVERLNTLRATIVTPGSGRGRGFGGPGRRRHPLDIVDGHHKGPKSHADVVHEVTAAAEELSRLLREDAAVPV